MKQHTGSYHPDDLVKVYRPPSLYSVWAGNKVVCVSWAGGPQMTVCEDVNMIDHRDAAPHTVEVLCMYEQDGVVHKGHFPLITLTCWGAK